jgi:hypothetical protein
VRVSFARVRRPFAGNAGAPPRPPHPLVDGQIPQLLSRAHPFPCIPWVLWTVSCLFPVAGMLAAGENANGRPAGRRHGRARPFLQIVLLFQGFQCKITEDPPKCLLFHVMFVLSCKIHNKSQKIPKLAKLVLLEIRL